MPRSANGYVLQQFIDKGSNVRKDEYGGDIENRTRFTKEVIKAVVDAIGEQQVGVRFSPWSSFQSMCRTSDTEDSKPHFMPIWHEVNILTCLAAYVHLCRHIKDNYPKFSYVHMVEDSEAWRGGEKARDPHSNDAFRAVFKKAREADGRLGAAFPEPDKQNPTLFISCGDYRSDTAVELCELKGDLVAVGRRYIANPDLPDRIRDGHELTPYDRKTFYNPLSDSGYIDYATYGHRGHGEEAAEQKEREKEQEEKAKEQKASL